MKIYSSGQFKISEILITETTNSTLGAFFMISRLATSVTAAILAVFIFAGGYVLGQSPVAPLQVFAGTAVTHSNDEQFECLVASVNQTYQRFGNWVRV